MSEGEVSTLFCKTPAMAERAVIVVLVFSGHSQWTVILYVHWSEKEEMMWLQIFHIISIISLSLSPPLLIDWLISLCVYVCVCVCARVCVCCDRNLENDHIANC